ncbi:ABC transporter permease [Chloroflexota bacterium]
MAAYIVRRSLQGLITVFIVLIAIFLLVRLTGDPSLILLPIDAAPEEIQQLRESLGLDKPIYVQLVLYLRDIATGNFGNSFATFVPIMDELPTRLFNTAQLVFLDTLLTIAVAVPLGVLAATRRGTSMETGIKILAFLGMSTPHFWLAIVMILLFAVVLGWMPAGGMGTPRHIILPVCTMTLIHMAGIVRLLRSGMVDTLDADYVKLAYSKGVSYRNIVWKHAFRNALIPVMTYGGQSIAIHMTGTIVVETVYSWPGIGRWIYTSMLIRDFPVIQACILSMVLITIFINLVVDICYSYVDPRIHLK